MVSTQLPDGRLPDGSPCRHEGQTGTYCTRCWMNLYETRTNPENATEMRDRERLAANPAEEKRGKGVHEIECSKCGARFNEAQKAWDRIAKTGSCPECGVVGGIRPIEKYAASLAQRQGSDNLMTNAVGVLSVSAVAAIWGYWYLDTHRMGAFFGGESSTFQIARFALLLGGLGFLLGIGLLVAALSRRK